MLARRFVPLSRAGWSALAMTAVGLSAWVVLPMITSAYREQYPITDTWLMPALGAGLSIVAAIANAWVVFRLRERTVSGIIAAALTIGISCIAVIVFVGGALTGQ